MSQNLSNDLLLQLQEQQTKNAETLGEIKSSLESLAGPKGRIAHVESVQSRQAWQSWAKSVLAPFLMLLGHGISRKLGLDI